MVNLKVRINRKKKKIHFGAHDSIFCVFTLKDRHVTQKECRRRKLTPMIIFIQKKGENNPNDLFFVLIHVMKLARAESKYYLS